MSNYAYQPSYGAGSATTAYPSPQYSASIGSRAPLLNTYITNDRNVITSTESNAWKERVAAENRVYTRSFALRDQFHRPSAAPQTDVSRSFNDYYYTGTGRCELPPLATHHMDITRALARRVNDHAYRGTVTPQQLAARASLGISVAPAATPTPAAVRASHSTSPAAAGAGVGASASARAPTWVARPVHPHNHTHASITY